MRLTNASRQSRQKWENKKEKYAKKKIKNNHEVYAHIHKNVLNKSRKLFLLSSFFIVKKEPFISTLPQQNVTSRYFMYTYTRDVHYRQCRVKSKSI